MYRIIIITITVLFTAISNLMAVNPDLRTKPWNASWIDHPDDSGNEFGVYFFRKEFVLEEIPDSLIIHVSADNRYKLNVNGKRVSEGTVSNSLFHWNYESVDIAPYLKKGKNVMSSTVWNLAQHKPQLQITFRTGFILQADAAKYNQLLNTNKSWKSFKAVCYQPLFPDAALKTDIGAGESVDFRIFPYRWEELGYADNAWLAAREISKGQTAKSTVNKYGWMLEPRSIAPLQFAEHRFKSVRKAEGVKLQDGFIKGKSQLVIPANSKVTLLLDAGYLINGYPRINFDGGAGAKVQIGYAESLFNPDGSKGHRDQIEGKLFKGFKDEVYASGEESTYTPLWWRTYRYVQIEVATADQEFTVKDFLGITVKYPFERKSTFYADKTPLKDILDIGWRTAELCAVETYMDCPYYERLQYVGDTRIQALISLYNSGDATLMKQAIAQLQQSMTADGLTLSRFPTNRPHLIPPFSLWWIAMLHDYWWYTPDPDFVKKNLIFSRNILSYFSSLQQEDASVTDSPFWNFTDWALGGGWSFGIAPKGKKGTSAILDLQMLYALQKASQLEEQVGNPIIASEYKNNAEKLKKTIAGKYWSMERGLFADNEDKQVFSQHANILAVLTSLVDADEGKVIINKVLSDTSLIQTSIYFKYYLHQAVAQVGLGDSYAGLLGIWKEHQKAGLTTWGEISDANTTRSDCHAWGSSPNIEVFRMMLGIDSSAPGFSAIKIQPAMGENKHLKGSIPHPRGSISAEYHLEKSGLLNVKVDIPAETRGMFKWKGKEYRLTPGINKLTIK